MPIRVFDLGDLRVTSRNTKQSLLLASSITLDLPTIVHEEICTEDMAEMTRTGRIWIAKAAQCRLTVTASTQELLPAGEEPNVQQRMVDAIGNCTIWENLSLKLRKEPRETQDHTQQDVYASLVINHPNLSSDYLSPKNIPCAKLLTVACAICYGSRPRGKPPVKPAKRRKIEVPEREVVRPEFGLRQIPRQSYTEGGTGDSKQPRNAPTLQTQDSGIGLASQDSNTQPERVKSAAEELCADAELLTKVALHKLLGLKKMTPGVRIRDLPASTLLDMMPAVFNIRYLQAFMSRAEHISGIASSLSNMDAESPSLRAKLRSLTAKGPNKDLAAELAKSLHILVQTGLDVPPITSSRRRTGTNHAEQEGDKSQQAESAVEHDTQEQTELVWDDNILESWSQDGFLDDNQQILVTAEEEYEEAFASLPYMPRTGVEPQQHVGGFELEPRRLPNESSRPVPPNICQSSQQPLNNDWLDLSQARYILDENGQEIAFEDLDEEDYNYELIPLGSDDQPCPS